MLRTARDASTQRAEREVALASEGSRTVGVPRESAAGERRVALTPQGVATLAGRGFDVALERGAGETAGYPDSTYAEKGARLVADGEQARASDVLLVVRGSSLGGAARDGQILIGLFDPLSPSDALRRLVEAGASIFALELLPRITRAQPMDALSSQATVAGYEAVILAARTAWKLFPKLTTAAGTIAPVRVFVVGVGVAGLQAIATARRLGAVVEAYDVRPAVREQVLSVGARFVELPLEAGEAEGAGGYARAMDESFYRRQRETMARVVAASDVVITTAAVPGSRAPVLITADMLAAMAPGSVVVDLVAAQGGNCELTRPDETVVAGGVTVLGPTNLAAGAPFHASQMYSRNVSSFLLHLAHDRRVQIDVEDEITRETLVARDGQVVHARVREAVGLDAAASKAEPPPAATPEPEPPDERKEA
ncbi:MAG: NAD(P) transhydrogenase subunit alpha [Gemmatimonadota bacterium]